MKTDRNIHDASALTGKPKKRNSVARLKSIFYVDPMERYSAVKSNIFFNDTNKIDK